MSRENRKLLGLLGTVGAIALNWGVAKSRRLVKGRTPRVPYTPTTMEAGQAGQAGLGATRELTRSEIVGLVPEYDPHPDGDPDPGEIVWTWVPYVENDGRGKDRPVLIIARFDRHAVAGCYLSTKRHDGFIPVGSGAWDPEGRESFVNPGRILFVSDSGMRREGHVVPPDRFEQTVRHIAALHGLSA